MLDTIDCGVKCHRIHAMSVSDQLAVRKMRDERNDDVENHICESV